MKRLAIAAVLALASTACLAPSSKFETRTHDGTPAPTPGPRVSSGRLVANEVDYLRVYQYTMDNGDRCYVAWNASLSSSQPSISCVSGAER